MNLVELPVFPLNAICFPGHTLPLKIFEDRYIRMLEDGPLFAQRFIVALICRGDEVGGEATPYRVGTVVEYQQTRQVGDFYYIQPKGCQRVYMESFDRDSHVYLTATCSVYEDKDTHLELPSELEALETRIVAMAGDSENLQSNDVERILNEMRHLLDIENYSLFLCGCLQIPLINLQHLLESRSVTYRLQNLRHILDATGPDS